MAFLRRLRSAKQSAKEYASYKIDVPIRIPDSPPDNELRPKKFIRGIFADKRKKKAFRDDESGKKSLYL